MGAGFPLRSALTGVLSRAQVSQSGTGEGDREIRSMSLYWSFNNILIHNWLILVSMDKSVAFLSPLHTCGCWRSAPHRRLPSARFHPVGGVLPVLDRFRPFPLCCGPLRVARLIHTRGRRRQPPHQRQSACHRLGVVAHPGFRI